MYFKFYAENKTETPLLKQIWGFPLPAKFIAISPFNVSKFMTAFQFGKHIFILVFTFASKL